MKNARASSPIPLHQARGSEGDDDDRRCAIERAAERESSRVGQMPT